MRLAHILAAAALALTATLAVAAPAADPLAPRGRAAHSPRRPRRPPVTETLWGKPITDNYRYMEALDPTTVDWMKAQGAYTRTVLDAIRPLPALGQARRRLHRQLRLHQQLRLLRRPRLLRGACARRRQFRPARPRRHGHAQDRRHRRLTRRARRQALRHQLYPAPRPTAPRSPSGISAGGSEDAALSVYDAATGAEIAGPIDRAQFGATSWSNDSKTLYFIRLKQLEPTDPGTEKYRDAEPRRLGPQLRAGAALRLARPATARPSPTTKRRCSAISPGSPMAVTPLGQRRAERATSSGLAPAAHGRRSRRAWTPCRRPRRRHHRARSARAIRSSCSATRTRRPSRCCSCKAGQPLAAAKVLVAAAAGPRHRGRSTPPPTRLYVATRAASTRTSCASDYKTGNAQRIALPARATSATASPIQRVPGRRDRSRAGSRQPTQYALRSGKPAPSPI